MNRRRFLLAGAAAVAGSYAIGHVLSERQLKVFAEFDMVAHLQTFQGRPLSQRGVWTPAQIFSHLAQSIEFSLTGYPFAKPRWFQYVVGATAFSAFSAAGTMTHNLAEPIPGAPALDTANDTDAALTRVITALQAFDDHAGELAPHFAYGALDKRQYRAAHLMHIRNHLTELAG